QRAADAKNRATQTNPHVKSAFTEVARGWLLLAEQMEWMDRQEEAKEGDASPTPTSPGVQAFPTWSLITRHNFGMPEIVQQWDKLCLVHKRWDSRIRPL